MKRIIALLVVFTLALVGLYVFLPGQQQTKVTFGLKANSRSIARFLAQDSIWQKMNLNAGNSSGQYSFAVQRADAGALAGMLTHQGSQYPSVLLLIELQKDSMLLDWTTTFTAGPWPWQRLKLLSEKNLVTAYMQQQLLQMKLLLEDTKNTYGAPIKFGTMQDSVLITTAFTTDSYPNTAALYAQIGKLQTYALARGADTTKAPMVFVQADKTSGSFLTRLALPVNTALPPTANIAIKNMVLGNNLSATVTGPESKVQATFKAMYQFVEDYQLTMPAIPYAQLVTNRLQQPDSNRWVTTVYFPIH
ncbi:MAG: hypothetical protein EAY75_04385 [Bacteroidetes bacterium]|nr:MAG: hypothetical protein EAY75_04385 [Bacteroidota bacterium]